MKEGCDLLAAAVADPTQPALWAFGGWLLDAHKRLPPPGKVWATSGQNGGGPEIMVSLEESAVGGGEMVLHFRDLSNPRWWDIRRWKGEEYAEKFAAWLRGVVKDVFGREGADG